MHQIAEGNYVHRFQGNALNKRRMAYFLAGIGSMTISRAEVGYSIVGSQESVASPLGETHQDPQQMVQSSRFMLNGGIEWNDARGLWVASIIFTGTGNAVAIATEGSYIFSTSGLPDHYWFMSTGSRIRAGHDIVIPVEAVSGEARLISRLGSSQA